MNWLPGKSGHGRISFYQHMCESFSCTVLCRLLVDTIQSTMAANLSLHPLVILTSDEARIEAIHKVIFKSTKKYKVC